jgi:hypothetical protein
VRCRPSHKKPPQVVSFSLSVGGSTRVRISCSIMSLKCQKCPHFCQ